MDAKIYARNMRLLEAALKAAEDIQPETHQQFKVKMGAIKNIQKLIADLKKKQSH
jgi:hypothetical protein